MPSALAFIGGGLLQGVGKGLVLSGKQKYEEALKKVEREFTLERDEKQREGRRGLLNTGIEARKTAAETAAGVAGDAAKITATATVKASEVATGVAKTVATTKSDRGIDAAKLLAESREKIAAGKPSKATDTTAAEDRIIQRHVETDKNGIETVNHEAAAVELEGRGFKKAAAAQRRKAKAVQKEADRREVQPTVEERVDALDTMFGSDAEDYKQYGGSRSEAVSAITAEEMKSLRDARSGEGASAPATRPAAPGPGGGEKPPPGIPADAVRGKGKHSKSWFVQRNGKWMRADPR